MVVWLRNLEKTKCHPVQAWIYTFGIRRGKIKVEEQQPAGLREWWIRHLEEVIIRLKEPSNQKNTVSKLIFSVSERSASLKKELRSSSIRPLILNVPRQPLIISSEAERYNSR
jgi:hypothetical protein